MYLMKITPEIRLGKYQKHMDKTHNGASHVECRVCQKFLRQIEKDLKYVIKSNKADT
jgi:hypothetical protein